VLMNWSVVWEVGRAVGCCVGWSVCHFISWLACLSFGPSVA
jgi:hypothetical protein